MYLNRCAVLVTPRQPFRDWMAAHVRSGAHDRERTVYLVPERTTFPELVPVLKEHYGSIFEHELSDWSPDVTKWPKGRTYELFLEWFEVEIDSAIIDIAPTAGPLVDEA